MFVKTPNGPPLKGGGEGNGEGSGCEEGKPLHEGQSWGLREGRGCLSLSSVLLILGPVD